MAGVTRPHPWLGQRGLTHGWGKEAPPMAGVKRPHPWLGGKEASPMAGAKRPHPWLGQRGLTHGWGKEASPMAGAFLGKYASIKAVDLYLA